MFFREEHGTRDMSKGQYAMIGLVLALMLGLGLLIGFLLPKPDPLVSLKPAYSTSTILRQVQGLSQLVTVKYSLEKVVVVEDVKWYGENRILLIAHGVAKAGVDLDRLQPEDILAETNRISIKLPAPVITDVYLDDQKTQVIERSTGLMRSFDKDLEQNARRLALQELRVAARQSGILVEAGDRARLQLTVILHQLGFDQVNFR